MTTYKCIKCWQPWEGGGVICNDCLRREQLEEQTRLLKRQTEQMERAAAKQEFENFNRGRYDQGKEVYIQRQPDYNLSKKIKNLSPDQARRIQNIINEQQRPINLGGDFSGIVTVMATAVFVFINYVTNWIPMLLVWYIIKIGLWILLGSWMGAHFPSWGLVW